MKKDYKNFIAFTLSEMMIVLLIISVISAATLPAITSRDEVKAGDVAQSSASAVSVSSNWMPDTQYTNGYYYRKNKVTQVLIGQDLSSSTAAQRTTANNTYGTANLVLARSPKIINPNQQRIYANSSIALYDKGTYVGGLGFDLKQNLSIGKYAGQVSSIFLSRGSYDNISIGYYSSANQTDASEKNVTLGVYAGYGAGLNSRSVIIGPYIQNYTLTAVPNIIIGSHAFDGSLVGSASSPTTNYIGIGAYSGYSSAISHHEDINIGYYAGAKISSSNYVSYSTTNIGAYAGYGSQKTFGSSSSVENIGAFAGAMSTYTSDLSNTSIGYYAGYGVIRYENINIGSYAGACNTSGCSSSERVDINIGKYAGTVRGTSMFNVNIGSYAGLRTGSSTSNAKHHSINIGHYAGAGSNVFVGYSSINIGEYAGYNSTGSANINIGLYAGAGNNGSNNIVLGSDVRINPTSKNISGSNNVFIGCTPDSTITSDYSFCVGGTSIASKTLYDTSSNSIWTGTSASRAYTHQMLFAPPGVKMTSSTGFSYTNILLYAKNVAAHQNTTMIKFSDKRLKENIKPTKYGIDKLRNIMVYQFKMIGDPTPRIGVIAQEVMKYYPDAVNKAPDSIKKGGYYSLNSDWFIFSLAQSIKDVDKLISFLSSDLSKNILNISELMQKTVKLENRLNLIAKSQQETNKQLIEMEKILVKMERK